MTRSTFAAVAAAVALGLTAGIVTNGNDPATPANSGAQLTAGGMWNRWPDNPASIPGPCGGTLTSPLPQILDGCVAGQLSLRGTSGLWANLRGTNLYKAWARDNHGEVQRLRYALAHPQEAIGGNVPAAQVMRTRFGNSLSDIVAAYAYIGGPPTALP